jgi:hypothetical protein
VISISNNITIPPFILACSNVFMGGTSVVASGNPDNPILILPGNALHILILAVLNFLGSILALPFCRTGNVNFTLAFFGFYTLLSVVGLIFGIWVNAWAILPYSVLMMIAFAWKYSNNRSATA